MLEDAIRRYQNRTIEAAQVIEELIELAKEMREDFARGQELGLNEDELAFYDAGDGRGSTHSRPRRCGHRSRGNRSSARVRAALVCHSLSYASGGSGRQWGAE